MSSIGAAVFTPLLREAYSITPSMFTRFLRRCKDQAVPTRNQLGLSQADAARQASEVSQPNLGHPGGQNLTEVEVIGSTNHLINVTRTPGQPSKKQKHKS